MVSCVTGVALFDLLAAYLRGFLSQRECYFKASQFGVVLLMTASHQGIPMNAGSEVTTDQKNSVYGKTEVVIVPLWESSHGKRYGNIHIPVVQLHGRRTWYLLEGIRGFHSQKLGQWICGIVAVSQGTFLDRKPSASRTTVTSACASSL